MAKQREPIKLIQAKGKKHLTKAEIAEREKTEVKAFDDNIEIPESLNKEQREKFIKIVDELKRIEIVSNLDVGCLERYIIADYMYQKIAKKLKSKSVLDDVSEFEKYTNLLDKYFKQCNACARELGLTISSRCRLVIPKAEEKPKENKFAKFGVV